MLTVGSASYHTARAITDIDLVYGQLGGFCENLATCGGPTGGSNDDEPSSTSTDDAPTTTDGPNDDDLPNTSDIDAITSSLTSLDPGCSSLADILASCSMATPGFTDLGYASQAKCYW